MAQEYDEDNLNNDGNAAVNYRGKDPLERMLDMKESQIRELKNDLAKKANQMAQKDKETREELSKKESELRDILVKKGQDWMDEFKKRENSWMEKVEDLRSQLGKRATEVHTYR